MVMDLVATDAFQETVQPLLDRVEEERALFQNRKRPFPYSVTEIERVFIFKAITGINHVKELRAALAGDNEEVRETLGLDRPRDADRPRKTMDGVPSEATLCRHRKLFDRAERAQAYRRLFERLRDDHLSEFPAEMLEELRLLFADGSKIEIEGVCPIYDKDKKTVINRKRVTCLDGGYVGPSASADHRGHGFNIHTIGTGTKLALEFEVTPLQVSESGTCEALLHSLGAEVFAKLVGDPSGLRVLTADGAYSAPGVRAAARRLGIVENIHIASHADSETVQERVTKLRAERIPIEGTKTWFSDGLYQLVCKCGQGTVRPDYDFDRHGGAIVRTAGTCQSCGPVSITSGKWRLAQNPKRWVRIDPSNPKERPQLAFGNPLTYDSPVAEVYGNQRRCRLEWLNSVLARRMGLTTGRRRYKTIEDARADVAIIYALSHLLAMAQRRAERDACIDDLAQAA
jgi:hypothetical protein